MKIDVINNQGQLVSQVEVPENIFGLAPNFGLLTQAVRVALSKRRQARGFIKTRAEVRGGGKKPWRQKGSGRARHGSIRSPLWVGGGVTHGPRGDFKALKMTKKMTSAALRNSLSLRVSENHLKVLQTVPETNKSVKLMQQFIDKAELKGSTLIIIKEPLPDLVLSVRNLPLVNIVPERVLNPFLIMQHDNILLSAEALLPLQQRLMVKTGMRGTPDKDKVKKTTPGVSAGALLLDSLGLSTRSLNALSKAGLVDIEELRLLSPEELLAIKGLGKTSVDEILDCLRKL